MAKSVNKVILLGNVGKDPEIKSTSTGTMVANFTMATSDRQKDAQGNWQDRTEWHSIVCFQRTAEIVRDYVQKGSKLYVEGKIQTRSWEDKQSGEKRYKTEIIVFDVTLLSGRNDDQNGGGSSQNSNRSQSANGRGGGYGSSTATQAAEYDDFNDEISDDDIPL